MDNMVTKRIAIIPARGGSKRIPNKNIINFNGMPMIYYSIQAAIDSNQFDDILVSTDSKEIAEIALKFGAKVPFLRNENYDDLSTSSQATLSALIQMEKFNGKKYETIVQLMPNCPLRKSTSITKQIYDFEKNKKKHSLISSMKYGMFNPWWAHEVQQNGSFSRLFSDSIYNNRSQDLPKLLCPTGAIWVSTRKKLIEYKTFYSPKYKLFELNNIEGIDIDDYDDLEFAKIALNARK
jgi:N-acylneuraminate cytidylyltransferase